jgi:D-alanyl-D-alanine endopeptidase (penicillin-binding protein 7)
MQTKLSGRKIIMVFLDSDGKLSRIAYAELVRRWVENQNVRSQVTSADAAAG